MPDDSFSDQTDIRIIAGKIDPSTPGQLNATISDRRSHLPAASRPNLYVSGRFLHDRRGRQVILRGVDYPLADDPQLPAADAISEIAKTGANAIRLQWYISYSEPSDPARPPLLTPEALGAVLDECIAANIIPIVMIADDTSYADADSVNTDILPWWTSREVMEVMQARQHCLILNLANEVGFVRWSSDANASGDYLSAYKTAIASMRAAGYTMPLMIDAPDGGTTIDEFTTHGAALVAADPLGNILLSVHAYWAACDGMQYIPTAVAENLPVVFGEIANFQDDVYDNGKPLYCSFALDGSGVPRGAEFGYTYQ
jgi:mannan endo-1,4-beta-mannosidase